MLTHLLLLAQITLPAFLGAQGGGATSVGGRGGQIIEVTNANDSGAGSLRACVMASGPRICIFRLGAQIVNKTRLQVNNPFLTIAGQTAPGGGITLGGSSMSGEALFIDTHDVVVQNVTCNGYNPNTPTGPDTGTVCFELTSGANNVIFDGITARWAGNKLWIVYSNDTGACCAKVVKNVTVQRSLFYEPNSTHPVGPGTDAAAWPNEAVNIDFHHTLFANIGHRIPMVATSAFRMVSTITYNWDYFAAAGGGSSWDFVNNKWVAGNMNNGGNQGDPHPVQFWMGQGGNCTSGPACDLPGTPSVYMSGNVGPQGTDYALTAEEPGTDAEGKPESASPIRAAWRRSSPLPTLPFPITADSTDALDAMAPTWGNSWGLDCAGNRVSHQDSQDARIIAQYKSKGPGGTFTGQFQQPAISAGTPCPEDPVNHLPLDYEKRVGIAAGTPSSTKAANGYTIFENYLAGTSGGTPPPPPPPPATSPSGTVVPPAASITDATGKVWTLGAVVPVATDSDCAPASCGNTIMQGGTALSGTAASLLLYFNGTVYQSNASGLWWSFNGTGWTRAAGDPRGGSTPPATPSISLACPSPITFPATSACVATVKNLANKAVVWSANAPGGVYTSVSGVTSATVTATALADGTKSASATIAIAQPTTPPAQPDFTITINIGTTSFTVTCTAANGAYTCR